MAARSSLSATVSPISASTRCAPGRLAPSTTWSTLGITFTVYSEAEAIDRILPFDCLPRIITAAEWRHIEAGVKQRVKALNSFLHDIYHDGRIIKEGVIPEALVRGNPNYRPEMEGFPIRFGTYVHICGIDIVRDRHGTFCVLEDNARTPSGVSYVVENRHLMRRTFPDLMAGMMLHPVDDYGPPPPRRDDRDRARERRRPADRAAVARHLQLGVFRARLPRPARWACRWWRARTCWSRRSACFMRTTAGLRPVHTIYRRIGDDFLDPTVFRPDSMLGVPGLIGAWRAGNVTLANAVGTGVADDKAVYAYMPRIIRFYLGEDAILPNVETTICGEKEGLDYTLANLASLVIKPVGESGGYGITIGPRAPRRPSWRRRARRSSPIRPTGSARS